LTHTLSCRAERADAQAIRPDLFTGKLFFDSDLRHFQRNHSENLEKPSGRESEPLFTQNE
jgi:hypothetical protein